MFYKLFRGDALLFYKQSVEAVESNFATHNAALAAQFNSAALKGQSEEPLCNMGLTSYCRDIKLCIESSLEGVYATITTVGPQLPAHLRAKPHLINFYKHAVIAHNWTGLAIRKRASDNLNFLAVHRELTSVLAHAQAKQRAQNFLFLTLHMSCGPQF